MSDEKLIPEVEEIIKDIERRSASGGGGGIGTGSTTGGRGGGHPEQSYPHLSGVDSGLVVESYTIGGGGGGSTSFPVPTPEVPEHIAKTVSGIKQYGHQWADQIEEGAKEQLAADTKRYEDSMRLAKRIREDAEAEAEHVQKWALTTRDASLIQRQAFAKLNGGGADAPSEKDER